MDAILYTKTVCPACIRVKAELARAGKSVTVVNVDRDEAARERLVAAGLKSLPVLEADGEFLTGPEDILAKMGCDAP